MHSISLAQSYETDVMIHYEYLVQSQEFPTTFGANIYQYDGWNSRIQKCCMRNSFFFSISSGYIFSVITKGESLWLLLRWRWQNDSWWRGAVNWTRLQVAILQYGGLNWPGRVGWMSPTGILTTCSSESATCLSGNGPCPDSNEFRLVPSGRRCSCSGNVSPKRRIQPLLPRWRCTRCPPSHWTAWGVPGRPSSGVDWIRQTDGAADGRGGHPNNLSVGG